MDGSRTRYILDAEWNAMRVKMADGLRGFEMAGRITNEWGDISRAQQRRWLAKADEALRHVRPFLAPFSEQR